MQLQTDVVRVGGRPMQSVVAVVGSRNRTGDHEPPVERDWYTRSFSIL